MYDKNELLGTELLMPILVHLFYENPVEKGDVPENLGKGSEQGVVQEDADEFERWNEWKMRIYWVI